MPDDAKKAKTQVTSGSARQAAARRARTRGRSANKPRAGAAAGGTTGPAAPNLRADAAQTLKDHEARWSNFRTDGGDVLNTYFNQTFSYLQGIIGPASSPTDWVKDGLALVIGYWGAGRKIWQATHKLYPYQD